MIAPNDPRHGTPAGYVAGCRDACCNEPRRRQRKIRELRNLRGDMAWATPEQVVEAVQPWRLMGLHDSAILTAAGLSNDHALKGRVRSSTLAALAAVTEDDFDDNATVLSDLTRRRIFSLMAIGHQLADMPVGARGQWRYRDRVRVWQSRAIRDHYAAHEHLIGPSRQTASRARNAGHLPPFAWDDPGTLAWPDGKPVRAHVGARHRKHDVDPVVVDRVLAGDRLPMTAAERHEVVRRAREAGWSLLRIEAVTGITKPERHIHREAS